MIDEGVLARDGIQQSNLLFATAFEAKDATGLAALYTEEAQLFPSHSDPVEGQEAIVTYWREVFGTGLSGVSLDTVEVDNEGDTAIETGRYRLTTPDGQVADEGKYLVVWKRIEDHWFIHRDIWNTSRPSP